MMNRLSTVVKSLTKYAPIPGGLVDSVFSFIAESRKEVKSDRLDQAYLSKSNKARQFMVTVVILAASQSPFLLSSYCVRLSITTLRPTYPSVATIASFILAREYLWLINFDKSISPLHASPAAC